MWQCHAQLHGVEDYGLADVVSKMRVGVRTTTLFSTLTCNPNHSLVRSHGSGAGREAGKWDYNVIVQVTESIIYIVRL